MLITIEIPYFVKEIMNLIESHGFEIYLVGGCIRDSILGNVSYDWDLITNALPNTLLDIFKKNEDALSIIDSGITFGTIGIYSKKHNCIVEITTYRAEDSYVDSRKPSEVRFISNVRDDLKRRDFSINALICKMTRFNNTNKSNNRISVTMELEDYHNGMRDIRLKIIKSIGDAHKSFKEDALRILRAIRFCATLDNFHIERHTRVAMFMLSNNLAKLSMERINAELCKIITSKNAGNILIQYQSIIKLIFPLLDSLSLKQYYANCNAISESKLDLEIRLAILLYSENIHIQKCRDSLTNLRFKKSIVDSVTNILLLKDKNINDKIDVKLMLSKNSEDNVLKMLFVKFAFSKDYTPIQIFMDIMENKECYKISHLNISGHDIKHALTESKNNHLIGEILKDILHDIIYEKYNNDRNILLQKIDEKIK